MNQEAIKAYIKRKVDDSGYVRDFDGTLKTDSYSRVTLPGTCNALEGNTLGYYRKGRSDHLIVLFMGGGLSWSAESAKYCQNPETVNNAKSPALYSPGVDVMTEFATFALTKRPGILALNKENPFSDWNVAVINYVTGDFHVGCNDFPFTDADGKQRILHHQGLHDFMLAMEKIKEFFPSPDKLLICGESAGAFAVPALAERVMAAYPACTDVTVFSDSALILLDAYKTAATEVWKAPQELTAWIRTNNLSADWYERLYAEKGDSIRYLYANSYRDYLFTTFQNYVDSGSFTAHRALCDTFTPRLKAHVERLRTSCPCIHFHINDLKAAAPGAKGAEHCLLMKENFFKSVRGEAPCVKWLADAVNGKSYDVGMGLLTAERKPFWRIR